MDLTRDTVLPVLSAILLAAYHVFLRIQVHRDPEYTLQSLLNKGRAAWVERMRGEKEGILAVQTLRNSIMGATFFASTAVALIVGTVTLSTQADRLSQIWSPTAVAPVDQHLWLLKILLLLVDMMCAFVFFAQAIRLNAHVGVMIGVPEATISNDVVTHLYVRAGRNHTRGMRCYYLAAPLVFWLFGPLLMFMSACALIIVLYFMDKNPED
jgi:uncharacterized membrane protein